MSNSKTENIVSAILLELEKGSDRGKMVAKFCKKWQISVRTFDRYWKFANERYLEKQQAIQKELAEQSKAAAIERLKKAILTKDERMEIASEIAKGKAWKVGDTIMVPTGGDRIKALDYLSKIDGDYAAIKKDVTIENKGVSGFILEE